MKNTTYSHNYGNRFKTIRKYIYIKIFKIYTTPVNIKIVLKYKLNHNYHKIPQSIRKNNFSIYIRKSKIIAKFNEH